MESGISVNAQYSIWILLVCLTWWLLWRMWRQRRSHQFCFIFAIENEYQSFKTVLNGDVVRARNAYYYLQFRKSTLSTRNQTKPNRELGIENLRVLSSYAPLINISVIRMEKFVKFRLTRVALLVKITLMSYVICNSLTVQMDGMFKLIFDLLFHTFVKLQVDERIVRQHTK